MRIRRSTYCFLIPDILPENLLQGNLMQNPFDWDNEIGLFSLGRYAFLNGIRLLANKFKEKNEILVPAYICEGTLWPLRDAGFHIKYYSVDDKFNTRIAELELKINRRTLAVVIVHFFGIPQEFEEIKRLCINKNIFLVEDCAHAFCGWDAGIALGSVGDISIFSIRKFLPTLDGGALVVNNKSLRQDKKLMQSVANKKKINYPRIIIRSLLNLLESKYNLSLRKGRSTKHMSIEELCPRTNIDEERKNFIDSEAMSDYAKRIFYGYNYIEMSQKRRNNYNILVNFLKEIRKVSLPFVYAKEGWSPYVLPIYVPETAQVEIIRGIIEKDTVVSDWPTLPSDLDGEEKKDAHLRSRRIILFPIHQNISVNQMLRTGEISKNIIERALC